MKFTIIILAAPHSKIVTTWYSQFGVSTYKKGEQVKHSNDNSKQLDGSRSKNVLEAFLKHHSRQAYLIHDLA